MIVPGFCTRCYHFIQTDPTLGRSGSKSHKIMLRHNQIMGNRYVMLDGREVPGSRGSTTIMSSVEISFRVDHEDAILTITPDIKGGGFAYSCRVGSRTLSDVTQVLESEDDLQVKPSKIAIPEIRTSTTEGKQVINYKLVATLSASDEQPDDEVIIYRRYSEFEKLNRLLRSAFTGSHLLSSLPQLPGKVYNPFVDQNEPSFIENRRRELEVYLKRLIQMPKMSRLSASDCHKPSLVILPKVNRSCYAVHHQQSPTQAYKNADLLRFLALDPVSGKRLDFAEIEQNIELRF